jgi:hypothetical protein
VHRSKKEHRMTAVGHSRRIDMLPPRSRHVRFAPKADKSEDISLSPLSAKKRPEQVQQRV